MTVTQILSDCIADFYPVRSAVCCLVEFSARAKDVTCVRIEEFDSEKSAVERRDLVNKIDSSIRRFHYGTRETDNPARI